MAKRGKLTEASGVLSSPQTASTPEEEGAGGVDAVHGTIRRKPGPRPDPARRGLRKCLLKLRPEHSEALRKAALDRAVAGKDRRPDASGVLRLLLDSWMAKGAKAP
jgi:hypothetical protein